MSLYERDYHAWAFEQAALARRRSSNELDWDNVAEELEDLGKQQQSELRSRYVVLLHHLLKWLYQPERKGRSWLGSIRGQRLDIAEHLARHPSLKAVDAELFANAYTRARIEAFTDTELDIETFPVESPFTPEQARDDDFWPEADNGPSGIAQSGN